jgi:prepilin-type N-terminal cleavage/methylation domain-containing protein
MRRGFTLVEILVAIVILSVGILAVSQMTVMGMQVTRVVNQKMYARAVMSRYYETLNILPNSDPSVQNWDGDNFDLDFITPPDPPPDFEENYQMGGVTYRVCWNAVNEVGNPVDDRIETLIRLWVLWNNDRNRIHTDIIKWRKF